MGLPIRTVFESLGEGVFRDAEADLLAELTFGSDAVLATGGGVVLRAGNRELLRSRTRCIYLHASPEDLRHRLKDDSKRPLLQVADPQQRLHELSLEREPLYREAATLVVDVRGMSCNALLGVILGGLNLSSCSPHSGQS